MTTDLLIAGTHFLANGDTDWRGVGRKAAGANISDLAAMGAQPVGLLVSIALPASFFVDDVLALYEGLHDLSSRYGAPIVGGDTTRSDNVCISITAVGSKDRGAATCLRSDAEPGDFVYVTGDLGGSRAGLEILLGQCGSAGAVGRRAGCGLDIEVENQLMKDHFSPAPRVDVGLALSTLFPQVAIIDISDSLYNEVSLLAEASGVELVIDVDAVPVSVRAGIYCESKGLDPQRFALFSGEEYELLFTVSTPPEKLIEQLRGAGVECAVTHVGTVNPGSGVMLMRGGHPVDPDDETFVHFP